MTPPDDGTDQPDTTSAASPVVPVATEPENGDRHRRRLVPILILAGIVAAIVAAVLLTQGGDSGSKVASQSNDVAKEPVITYPGSGTTTANAPATTAAPSSGGGHTTPSNAPPVAPPTGANSSGTPTTHATTPPPPTTAPGPAAPTLSANAAPGAIYCSGPNANQEVNISWMTTNATYVTLSAAAYAGQNQPPNSNVTISDGCSTNSVTVTAHGPGGSTSTTVSWHYLSPPPT
jgi:hypothetical protein